MSNWKPADKPSRLCTNQQLIFWEVSHETFLFTSAIKIIPCNRVNKETERCSQWNTQNTVGRKWRKHKTVQRFPMFMDEKRLCCLNIHISQSDLQIQHNSHQNINGILTELWKLIHIFLLYGWIALPCMYVFGSFRQISGTACYRVNQKIISKERLGS